MAPTIQEIRKEMVAGLDDHTITEAINAIIDVVDLTPPYCYEVGTATTAEERADQFLRVLNIVSDTLFFVHADDKSRANE